MADVAGLPGKRGGNGRRPFGGRSISALLAEIARAPEVDVSKVIAGLRPGSVVDARFEVVREVGRGGFGVVYEARDLSLGRSVAFKVVSGGARDGMREERLLREAAAAARLCHPNIVQLFDMGQSEHGPYLVFELLHGDTLDGLLAAGPLSTGQALHVARDVAAALAHAHAAGVFHRDLKPANVLVGAEGHSKVLDFGLARAFGQRSALGGTPAYMAPEQWRGAPEDERTDVFALGVLIFQMLSGELPFPAETGSRDARSPPILEVPDISPLGPLVQRMLARDPVERPRDAAAVARELDEMGAPLEVDRALEQVRPRLLRGYRTRMAACAAASVAAGAALGA
ncbi:MAG: serine/threonine-protein kinase, partial [Anaeromyxobacteraceae bacterium]